MPSNPSAAEALFFAVGDNIKVSGLLQVPPQPQALLVLAHGAGAGMTHPFMARMADGLASRRIATLRYQFPYIERGSKRPDPPALAQATVRAAALEAAMRCPDIPLFAGGKSFGGRMTSQAQAKLPLPNVRGLVFVGFPLHPAGKPSQERAEHLHAVTVPMLFLQGSRDTLAMPELIKSVCDSLAPHATLKTFPDADHSFHVPAKSGQKDSDVFAHLLDTVATWITSYR